MGADAALSEKQTAKITQRPESASQQLLTDFPEVERPLRCDEHAQEATTELRDISERVGNMRRYIGTLTAKDVMIRAQKENDAFNQRKKRQE